MRVMTLITLLIVTILSQPRMVEGQALNEAFLNSTVYISYPTNKQNISFGSGFLIFRKINGNSGHVFLITNKHVIPKEGKTKAINLRVRTKINDQVEIQEISVPVVGHDGKYLSHVKLNQNEDFDVAAINITDEVLKNKIDATWIPSELLVTKQKLRSENITVGDEIFILGYPDAIFDSRNTSPVLRIGVISTVPTEGYAFNEKLKKQYKLPDEIDGFLIDANLFPGSSGSVVILKQQPTTIGTRGQTVVSKAKKIPYVLGIVAGSIPIIDTALKSIQRMGLGIVYSADTIRDTIELFYTK